MVSGIHGVQTHGGALFLDRDPELFEYVLDFLRSGPDFEMPTDARTQRRLLKEFRYLGLPTTIFRDLSPSLARIYAVGGCTDTHMHRPSSTVLCYDTNFEGWCDVAELPTARACVAAATLGGRLYVLGGKDSWGKEMTGVYTCDLSSHAISTDEVRPMATPRHTFGAATAAGRVYVVGHGRLADEQETTEFFDPGSMAWWSTTPLPQAPRHHAVVSWPGPCGEPGASSGPMGDHSPVVFSSGGYVSLPGVGLTCSSELMMLDVRTKAWKPLGPMPISRARHGMAACAGRLFLIGGSTTGACAAAGSSGTPERATASVHCYDVRAGRWVDTEAAPLPRPLESLAAVAVGGQVHVLGGLCSGQSSGGGGSGSGSPRRPRVQSAAGVVASTLPRNLSERHHATAGVLLEEREMAAGLKQLYEDRQVHDGVVKCDGAGTAWVMLRSMRTPMHSMAAVAYQG